MSILRVSDLGLRRTVINFSTTVGHNLSNDTPSVPSTLSDGNIHLSTTRGQWVDNRRNRLTWTHDNGREAHTCRWIYSG